MRRFGVITLALLFLTILGMLSPPAQAQAPTPKVSLGGLIDVASTAAWNLSQVDVDFTRASDSFWAARQRAVLVTLAEVEKARGVMAIELDLNFGMTDAGATQTALAGPNQTAFITGGGIGRNTDVVHPFEVKHLYVEFPLPLVPWPTTMTFGAQASFGKADYKGNLMNDDFPGLYLLTTFTPALKSHIIYLQSDEDFTGSIGQNRTGTTLGTRNVNTRFNRGDDWMLAANFEVTPWKGLDVRPLWIHWENKGLPTSSQNTPEGAVGGVTTTGKWGSDQAKRVWDYFGIDLRWKSGPWSLDPTFVYLYGTNDLAGSGLPVVRKPGGVVEQDVRSWIADIRGSYRTGPLFLQGLFAYVPGNDARDNLGNTAGAIHDQNYFQPPLSVFYAAGFSNFFGGNEIDFLRDALLGATGLYRGSNISFDRYGMITAALKPRYALTRALSLHGLAAASWTAEDVDTHGVVAGATGITPETNGARRGGDDNFLGHEYALGLTWAFAPGLTLDLLGSHLFAGEGLEQCKANLVGGVCQQGRRDARDATSAVARLRFAF